MDESKLAEFMGRLVADMGGAAMVASIIVGEELGLYRAMSDGRPTSADELAAATGCHPRLVLEWLNAQAASGYVEFVDGTYRLPEEQALALAIEDSPVYMAGGAGVLAALFLDKDKQVAAIARGRRDLMGRSPPVLVQWDRAVLPPGYKANLVSSWLPALDGAIPKLESGARVADVGCGHGASTVLMAEAFPASRFFGFDFHGPSMDAAQERAAAAGVADRITFKQAAADAYEETGFDLVCFFDCLHDMGDPAGAARHAYEALEADGAVLLVEPFAGDRLEDNCNPVGRMYYAASTFICTPNSLSQDVGRALGAQAGEARLRDVFTEAGFTSLRRATETPFNLILEARK